MRPKFALVVVMLLGACAGPDGVYERDGAVEATAFISRVVAAADGDDLEVDGGEHVVISHELDIRNDLGGWWIEDADGNRLNLGIGTQIDPGGQLAVHTGCGTPTDEAVFNCLDEPVLDDDGDVLVLRDAAGAEVDRFAYGTRAD